MNGLYEWAHWSHNHWFVLAMVTATGSIPMPETTKKDEESDAKTQLEDGEQIANTLPPFIPQRRRGGKLSD